MSDLHFVNSQSDFIKTLESDLTDSIYWYQKVNAILSIFLIFLFACSVYVYIAFIQPALSDSYDVLLRLISKSWASYVIKNCFTF